MKYGEVAQLVRAKENMLVYWLNDRKHQKGSAVRVRSSPQI